METVEANVLDFHKKQGYKVGSTLEQDAVTRDPLAEYTLREYAAALHQMAIALKPIAVAMQARGDERLYRLWLLIEEVAEGTKAMKDCDELEFADFLADAIYVLVGTGITFSIPIAPVIEEVHRSNMTKGHASKDNVAYKGEGYSPPDIRSALEFGRREQSMVLQP